MSQSQVEGTNQIDLKQDYFQSYGSLEVHRLMLEDIPRTKAFIDAIENASTLFRGKVVMDVGAGSGILTLAAAKAGATKVYAVEASEMATLLPKVVQQNGFEGIVQVIHSKVEDVKNVEPQSVDIIISEWMGHYLLHESMLDSVLIARDKFLKKSGLLFPNLCRLYAAVCSIPSKWKDRVGFWKEKQYGFDFSAFDEVLLNSMEPEIYNVPPEAVMSEPQMLWKIDLQSTSSQELNCLADRRFFSIEQEAYMHGVVVWFDVEFPTLEGKAVHLEEGDIIGWNFKVERACQERNYSLKLELLDGDEEHPIPCSCGSLKCVIVKTYIDNSNIPENEDPVEYLLENDESFTNDA